MPTLAEVRQQYPQYGDMSDTALADALHTKFYSDMPKAEFHEKIGHTPEPDQTTWYGRALQGAKDAPEAIAQIMARGSEVLSPIMARAGAAHAAEGGTLIDPEEASAGAKREATVARQLVDARVKEGAQDYEKSRGENAGTFDPARLAGNVAVTAPVSMLVPGAAATSIPRMIASGMGQGAISGALQPVENGGDNFVADKAKQIGLGTLAGGGASGVLGGAARIISPATNPEVRQLMQAGVTPTPGQILGGTAQRAENLVAKAPFLGDIVRSGQQRAGEEYNIAGVNQALAPMGKALPEGVRAGNEAIAAGREAISRAYDEILPKITAQSDPKFQTELLSYIDAAKEFPKPRFEQFANSVETQFKKVPPSGEISGPLLQEIKSHFSRLGSNYLHSSDADQRLLGGMFNNVADSLKNLAARSSPDAQEALSAVDAAHARMMRVEVAAGKNLESGVFSPSQLLQASKSLDQTVRDKASSQGRALMQPFGQAGSRVLGPSLPRAANSAGAAGGVAGLGTLALASPGAAAAGLGAAGMYTPVGQRAMASLLTQRPAVAAPMAQAVQSAAPVAATGAASYIANETPREKLARLLAAHQQGM